LFGGFVLCCTDGRYGVLLHPFGQPGAGILVEEDPDFHRQCHVYSKLFAVIALVIAALCNAKPHCNRERIVARETIRCLGKSKLLNKLGIASQWAGCCDATRIALPARNALQQA
jgi:hypothetical protein